MISSVDVANILIGLHNSSDGFGPINYDAFWYYIVQYKSTPVKWYDVPLINYDCGTCINCKDKPKFGGVGIRKQRCVKKIKTRFEKILKVTY